MMMCNSRKAERALQECLLEQWFLIKAKIISIRQEHTLLPRVVMMTDESIALHGGCRRHWSFYANYYYFLFFFLQIISNSQIIFTTSVYVLSPMSKLLQYLNLCINIFLSMKVHGWEINALTSGTTVAILV